MSADDMADEPSPTPTVDARATDMAAKPSPPPTVDARATHMAAKISEIEALERRAKSSRGRNLWVQVSRVGTLGWLIALPIVGGALLGHFIDRHLGTGLTFTLALLLVGVALAGFALWRHTKELED